MASFRMLLPLAVALSLSAGCSSSDPDGDIAPASEQGGGGSGGSGGAGGGGAGGGGSGGGEPANGPLSWDVTKDGGFTCGHRILKTKYTPPGGLPERTIPVHVWYPSKSTEGDHPLYRGAFLDEHAYDDVPLAPDPGGATLPVLVHSHGYKGFAGNSARLFCHFAQQGWLAVAPEHVGNTIGDTPDKLPLAIYIHRPMDMRAALDLMTSLPAEDPLAGRADMSRVALSGHSFGTYTAWVSAGAPRRLGGFSEKCDAGSLTDCTEEQLTALGGDLSEPRAKIAMALAGAPQEEIEAAGFDAVGIPVLMMSGTLDTAGDDKLFPASSKMDLLWGEVEGGCHQLYGLGNTQFGDASCEALSDEEGFSIVNPFILAYARYHVLSDRSADVEGYVDGTKVLSDKLHLHRK
jgi:predicted dienelactone hydrolase